MTHARGDRAAAHPLVHADPAIQRRKKYVFTAISYLVCNWVERSPGGECEVDTVGRSQDPRRAGARILDTAEGVLIALRGCTLNEAFVEIVQTAKARNVSTLSLADALVALAQDQASQYVQDAAFDAARATWGRMFEFARPSRGMRFGRDDDVSGA